MGGRKTVNGAYRYRYAPFLMPTYYAAGRSPLALPLGELSPQVTERVLPFALSVLAALGHLSQRERQGVLAFHDTRTGTADYPAVPVQSVK